MVAGHASAGTRRPSAPQTDELLQWTKDCAQAAMQKMQELRIPTNSTNFYVWYTYFTGEYPDIAHEINSLMQAGVDFSGTVCDMLFDKYFGSSRQEAAAKSAYDNITDVLGTLKYRFDDAEHEVMHFGEALETFSEVLSGQSSSPAAAATSSMMAATERMRTSTSVLGRTVDSAQSSVVQLRADLDRMFAEANLDRLTLLENWKCFYSTLRQSASRAVETGEPLTLLLIDIDSFATFNERFGRAHGDHLLRLVARTIKNRVADRGSVARFSGDAFGVILSAAAAADALCLAEALRQGFASQQIVSRHEARDYGSVTVSIAVVSYRDQEPLSHLMHRCLSLLHDARARGGNQVVTDSA